MNVAVKPGTHTALVELKHGNMTFDDVIKMLLDEHEAKTK